MSNHKFRARNARETATERLEARIGPEQKMFFQRAASLRGVTLKEFMVASMHEAAVKTMEEHELLSLSAQEQRVFVQVLLNPSTPNSALRAATKRYKKMTGR